MHFLLYIFISIFYFYGYGQAKDIYSPIISDLGVCQINDDGYFFNIRSTQKVGKNCAGFWPKDNKLSLCRRNSDFSLQYGQIPRENCHDLINLPLCRHINDVSQRIPGQTCVYECKNLHLSSVQYMPNYGHNYYKNTKEGEEIGCVRFCDDPIRSYGENVRLTIENKECTKRMCHQYVKYEDKFISKDCQKIPCNLLYKDEISYKNSDDKLILRQELVKFDLCNNELQMFKEIDRGQKVINVKDKIKCYDIGLDKLPLFKQWLEYNPKICEIHSCYISQNKQRFLTKNNVFQTTNEYCPFRGEIIDLTKRCNDKKYKIDNNCDDNISYLEKYITNILGFSQKEISDQILSLRKDCSKCNDCIENQDCFERCTSCYDKETDEEYKELAIYEILGSSCSKDTENNNIFDNYCRRSNLKDVYVYNDNFLLSAEDKNKCEVYIDDKKCSDLGLLCNKFKNKCDLTIDNSLFYELISGSNKLCQVGFSGDKQDCADEYSKKDALQGYIESCVIYKPYEYQKRHIFKCKISKK